MGPGSIHIRCLRSMSVVTAAFLMTGALAACGGDDDSSSSDGAGAPVSSGSTVATTSKAAETGGDKDGPTLSGDRVEAQAGLDAVSGVYEGFSAAVDKGIASVDVPARETLDNARSNASLAGVCDLMSEEAKRQTIVYVKRSAGLADVEWTCESATGLLLRRARTAGSLKRTIGTEVVGVNVDGDRATASVRSGRRITSVPLVKEDGKWKLAASMSAGGGG